MAKKKKKGFVRSDLLRIDWEYPTYRWIETNEEKIRASEQNEYQNYSSKKLSWN